MRILIFTQYFSPEIGATQTRLHTFAAGLAARGHHVDVVCEIPNHPQGVVRPGFGGRPVERRQLDGFTVHHVWVRTTPVKTTRTRLAFYGSYAAMAAAVAVRLPRPDVIFASSPPLPVGLPAAFAAWRHRVPWVLDVRDLWPEAAVAMGELTNPRVLRLAERLEERLYRSATAITAVTEPFRRAIAEKTGDPSKVHLLPNGTTQFWVDGAKLPPDRMGLGLPEDRFIWTFAGNVGAAQGLESAIDAAVLLGEEYLLIVLGNGPARQRLEERAVARPEAHVRFLDQVPPSEALRYLRSSDALLVSLSSAPELASFVPSKLFDFCAVGRPVIVAASGEPTRIAERSRAALPVPAGDASALAAAVTRLRRDPDLRSRLARSGTEFGQAHLRDRQVDALSALISSELSTRGRRG